MELKIKIEDYSYDLPDDRIAKYPLEKRDASRILIYRNGNISDSVFSNLAELLPDKAIMIFNDTKVVPARLFFRKPSGALIEVFCLEPFSPAEYSEAFAVKEHCVWKCAVGNAKKWKDGAIFFDNHTSDPVADSLALRAEMIERKDGEFLVKFSWNTGVSFSEVLSICGNLPIPPYLNRETEALDLERYQTLYAKYNGSVAAPTAGLHFTGKVLDDIRKKGILMDEVCLHVGAGTFLPVKSEYVDDHRMHSEAIVVRRSLIANLIRAVDEGLPVVSVGTTSTRTLESLYYIGAGIIEHGCIREVEQWAPYEKDYGYSLKESLSAIYNYMESNNMDSFTSRTRIIIVPVYRPKVVDILITNFHQPQSTLLLLIGAFVGDNWKRIYDYAMSHGFRFLSYGDSSVLFRER